MNKPLVSIIMPAYNAATYIEESLASVLAQSYDNWELLVIEDGSIDKTQQIVKDTLDKRIKLIIQDHKGPGVARNCGIKKAKGSLIAFLDADDLWYKDKLAKQIAAIDKYDVDLVFCDGYVFGDGEKTTDFNTVSGQFSGQEMLRILFNRNVIGLLSVLVKKQALESAGSFANEGLNSAKSEDYDLWLRLADKGCSFYGLSQKLCRYRIHPNSYELQRSLRLEADATVVENYLDNPAISQTDQKSRLVPLYKELIYLLAPANRNKAKSYQEKLAKFEPSTIAKVRNLLLFNGHLYKLVLDSIAKLRFK